MLLFPVALVALAIAALLGAAAADAWSVRRSPEIEVRTPNLLSRGVPATFEVAGGAGRGSVTRARQATVPDVVLDPAEGPVPLMATIKATRRGRHPLPPAALRIDGPLGLGRWHHSAPAGRELVVYPDMPAARRLAAAVREGRFRDALARGQLGLGTDFESIRDYLPDDDIRQVNWAATARTGRPMSNQYRIEEDREVHCLIDAGRLMGAPLGDRTRLDAAVDAVAAVGMVADVVGDHSGMIAFDSEILRRLRPRRNNGLSIVRSIFDLEASERESDYELAFRTVGASKRAFVLVLTDILEESAARPLLDAIPVLARHHFVAVASTVDTELLETLTRDPVTEDDVYAAAVAAEVVSARERVARSLRGAGAVVIETSPEALGRECVRVYLRAKARARL